MYEIDYDHVVDKEINGINVTLYFSKQKNEKIKDTVLDILMDSYEKRMQDYIEKGVNNGSKFAENVV